MRYPCILIESPHQGRARAFEVWDAAQFERHAEASATDNHPLPDCPTDADRLAAIARDLHCLYIVESPDELPDFLDRCIEYHNGPSIRTETIKAAEILDWERPKAAAQDDIPEMPLNSARRN